MRDIEASEIYQSTDYLSWDVNRGDKTVHARRLPGRFRTRQWLVMTLIYAPFFLIPYFTWGERQAVLLDIAQRKFYFFGAVIWPQDLWVLALFLLFCFVLMFAMTAIAGRIFCGFVCPQTTWTNFFTWIENFVEGPPAKRIKLEQAPWKARKIFLKSVKHTLWLVVCVLSAVTFIGYFSGIYTAWRHLLTVNFSSYEWVTFGFAVAFIYMNAGFAREQFCLWVCPYARIQGVLADVHTKMVTYDVNRGEPRGKLKAAGAESTKQGDCIDCQLCVAACPTGVDIRKGQQLGCINCGLCIDACDAVMSKVGKVFGLIGFRSQYEMETHQPAGKQHLLMRARPFIYSGLAFAIFLGMLLGVGLKSELDINVTHERNPVYTVMADGSIQNVYHLLLLNKSEHDHDYTLDVQGEMPLNSNVKNKVFHLKSGEVKKLTLYLKASMDEVKHDRQPVLLVLSSVSDPSDPVRYSSMFIGPQPEM